jgi:hypothetical protein
LKGVKEVSSGFRKFREINTLIYDPQVMTPEEMVAALKAVNTYIGIAME